MHTRLPDFYDKMKKAGKRVRPETEVVVRGLENLETAKLASLRVGRVESEVYELSQNPDVSKIEVIVTRENPETVDSVIIKSYRADGTCPKAILERMYTAARPVESYYFDAEVVEDRRGITCNDVEGVIIKGGK